MKKNIVLIEACSDLGAGTQGAAFGPEALQLIAQTTRNNISGNLPRKQCYIPFKNGYTSIYAKNIELVYSVCRSIAYEVFKQQINGNFPIILSGDHSCAAGTIAGLKMVKPQARLGVVWIDAHADLHSPYTTPSGNMHGMPLAASININNITNARQGLDAHTKLYWEKFKNLGAISPKILPQDIVYVSLRDFEKEEASLIKTYGIKYITTDLLRKSGINTTINSIFKQLSNCTDIYVSFDTDSLDATISKGTGLPVEGGLLPWEAEQLIDSLLENPKICCFEITELNPFFDINCETTSIIYRILEKGIAALNKDKVKEIMYQLR